MEYFRIRHVEVRGTTLAEPADIVRILGVDSSFSLWADLDSLAQRVRALPYVAGVEVSRRPPGTLIVTVRERRPVAFVPARSSLVPVDRDGVTLPFDPVRAVLDLPVVQQRDTAVLRLLDEIRSSVPQLFARISEARRESGGDIVLRLESWSVRLRGDVAPASLGALFSVEADLARRGLHPVELDLRFRDQIVARLP
jgi:cell division protein FtsQ